MAYLIFQALYFFLPAYFANMAPILFRRIPWLNKPVHEKLFGAHKTWRGLVIAVLVGGVIFAIQKYLHYLGFQTLSLIDYNDFNIGLGFLMGAGAIIGDLVKSYYKRKENIASGESWFPFDQEDFVIGGIIGTMFVYVPQASVVLILLIASPILHIATNHLGYWMGMRKKKW